jgi:uncharacterized protein (TIGR02246 family)
MSAMTREEEEVRAVVAAWNEASKRGDTAKVLSLMTKDAVFLVPGAPPMDRAGFEAASKGMVAGGRPLFEARQEIEEVVVSGDVAYMRAFLRVSITMPGTFTPTVRAGYTLTIFRREADGWKLARDANLMVKSA